MIIVLIIILSLIFRLVSLNQSLWLDEAVQAITAQKSLGFIFQELSGDFHPPLYHFLMHYWVRVFGSLEVALRMPSVLFGVGTVFILYKIAMHIHGRFVAVLVALFFATAPFHIYYSQEARMYSLAAFLTTGSFYFFLRILEDDRGWLKDGRGVGYFLGYFLFTLLALYTDYYAFLVLLAQSIFLLTKKRYKFLLLNNIFLILLYLPWVPMLITQMKVGMLATQNLPEWGKLINVSFLKAIPLTLIKFSIGRITIFNKTFYGLFSGILILGIGLIIARGYLKGKKLLITNYQLLITLWFFVPLLITWMASLFIPNYQPFRLLLILPSFYLLLARGIHNIKSPLIQKLFIFLILSVNIVSLGVYYFNPYFHREDWRGVTRYLVEQKDSVVVLPSETSSWPIRYYNPQGNVRVVYGETGVETVGEVRDLGAVGNSILYIRYLVPLFDPSEKVLVELGARGYTKVKEISFNQIPLWEFKKK